MPTASRSATNSYVKSVPDGMVSWVYGGTPSIEFGRGMPCQLISLMGGVGVLKLSLLHL